MAKRIPLTLSCGNYDRTEALLNGSVCAEGIDLKCLALEPNEIFQRMLLHEEFDVSEMSMSNYIMERSEGNWRFTAIPVFLSRAFRHSNIFVNTASMIDLPKDLINKKIGLSEYHSTAALWLRGILGEDYGIKPSDIKWVTGGIEKPSIQDRMQGFAPPSGVSIEKAGSEKCLSEMLRTGEIDAVISASKPSCFDGSKVKRLWPDYRRQEEEYFQRTKYFPIMHVVVIKTAILKQNPWVANSLYRAFLEAKDLAVQRLTQKGTLPVMLPWAFWEAEQAAKLMGDDFWPYGLEKNREILETMLRFSHEQGLCKKQIAIDELFSVPV